MIRRTLVLALALALPAAAGATDLMQTYEMARNGDPQLAAAESNRLAQKEGAVQASYVTDMGAGDWTKPGSLPWIAADAAIYVVGSTRLSGMDQPETVPFARTEDARAFIAQYGGQLMRLAEIPETVLAPVPPEVQAAEEADYRARMQKHDHAKMQGGM